MMVERRDQVFTNSLRPAVLSFSTRFNKKSSKNGPFLMDRATIHLLSLNGPHHRRRMISRLDSLSLSRVFLPLVGTPQGVTG